MKSQSELIQAIEESLAIIRDSKEDCLTKLNKVYGVLNKVR